VKLREELCETPCPKIHDNFMIAIIQRVSEALVKIEGKIKGEIQDGFLVLLGITHTDTQEDVEWLSKKIVGMRIFSDEDSKMNLDLNSVEGNILLISQFTLHASTKKGNRPSFIEAARPEIAIPLYEKMILQLERDLGKPIQTGEFGADMKVSLINDGPVTIILDSKNKI
jgi:D-aminoacyl-tRNA deacylase